ncbi:MAG: hypothetical protein HOV87_11920 [Catenulispora sp.]|nr:hypothetical protein [Catenulispora sp.]NUT40043.1 hypothetical protein [Thermoactinospora sp.]
MPSSSLVPPSAPYGDYMHVGTLLSLQRPPHVRAHPDELHFQATHQVIELLLACLVEDLGRAAAHVDHDDLLAAERMTGRAALGVRIASSALELLSTLTLADYNLIRRELGRSSAAQSPGWHRTEATGRALAAALDRYLARHQLDLVAIVEHARPVDAHRLITAVTDLDTAISDWRWRHFNLAARLIGPGGSGTQGTALDVLARRAQSRLFGDVWKAYATVSARAGSAYGQPEDRP